MEKALSWFAFTGRSSRGQAFRALFALGAASTLVLVVLMIITSATALKIPAQAVILVHLPLVTGLAATCIRRMHDRNRPGWWLAVFLALFAAADLWAGQDIDREMAVAIVLAPFMIWLMLEIFGLKGTEGPNRYGPDPLHPSSAEVVS